MTSGSTTTTDWSAPYADRPVVGTFTVPGSKSLTNRYLVLAALADDESLLRSPLRSRDTLLMAAGLRAMGIEINDVEGDVEGELDWHVVPHRLTGGGHVDCGLAGTVMRFLPPIAALADGPVTFDGDEHARTRPMGPVLGALTQLGVRIDDDGRRALPFTVHGAGHVRGGEVALDASASSQFVSALLLAGARFDDGLRLIHRGEKLPSTPHIDMTVEVLRDAGVVVEDDTEAGVWEVEPSSIRSLDVEVEPDLSNAAPFLAAAAVTGGRVTMRNWPSHTSQPGDRILDILALMGADVERARDGVTVVGPKALKGVDLDLSDEAELTPVVAAVCALAESPSRIRGVAHIRGHETDRLKALSHEINALGGDVAETADGLFINPRHLRPGLFRTYADHRMAMAAAVLGLRTRGLTIENIATTGKTLPDFDRRWSALVNGR